MDTITLWTLLGSIVCIAVFVLVDDASEWWAARKERAKELADYKQARRRYREKVQRAAQAKKMAGEQSSQPIPESPVPPSYYCKVCRAGCEYSDEWDSYYCPLCNRWNEATCGDLKCTLCMLRPEKPILPV